MGETGASGFRAAVRLPVLPGDGVAPPVMKMSDLKDFTIAELAAKGRDLRQDIFNLRLQQASSQLEKPARLRTLRRDIARIETQISALRKKTV